MSGEKEVSISAAVPNAAQTTCKLVIDESGKAVAVALEVQIDNSKKRARPTCVSQKLASPDDNGSSAVMGPKRRA